MAAFTGLPSHQAADNTCEDTRELNVECCSRRAIVRFYEG